MIVPLRFDLVIPAGLQNHLRAKYADKRPAVCKIAAPANDNMPSNASNGRLLAVFGSSFVWVTVAAATGSDGAVEFAKAALGSSAGASGVTKNATIRMVSIISVSGGSDGAGTSA